MSNKPTHSPQGAASRRRVPYHSRHVAWHTHWGSPAAIKLMGTAIARLFQQVPKNHPTFLRTQTKWNSFVIPDFWIRSLTTETIKAFVRWQARVSNKQAQKEDTAVDSFGNVTGRVARWTFQSMPLMCTSQRSSSLMSKPGSSHCKGNIHIESSGHRRQRPPHGTPQRPTHS